MPGESSGGAGRGLAGRRVVLIVDDHADTLELVSEVFEWSGAHPVRARSVDHAREVMRGVQVHAVVTDYAMPGTDGLTFLRELRASEAHAQIPVVMLSGQATDEVRREVEGLGARYLAKPADLEALLATVDALLARSDAA